MAAWQQLTAIIYESQRHVYWTHVTDRTAVSCCSNVLWRQQQQQQQPTYLHLHRGSCKLAVVVVKGHNPPLNIVPPSTKLLSLQESAYRFQQNGQMETWLPGFICCGRRYRLSPRKTANGHRRNISFHCQGDTDCAYRIRVCIVSLPR